MAVRDDFSAGEVLAAADLNDTFAEKLPYSYGTATPSTSVDGFLWYDENDTPPTPKFWDGAAFQSIGRGKILQVVRATDSTDRSTTSTSYVDASLSVTITPTKSTSAIILIHACRIKMTGRAGIQIADASNNAISGAEGNSLAQSTVSNFRMTLTTIAYATPATISATTYKVRMSNIDASTTELENASQTGQMYAIEVSA